MGSNVKLNRRPYFACLDASLPDGDSQPRKSPLVFWHELKRAEWAELNWVELNETVDSWCISTILLNFDSQNEPLVCI